MSFEQPTAAEYAQAAADAARKIAEEAREAAYGRPAARSIRTTGQIIEGFGAYGHVVTSVAGTSHPGTESIGVTAIHQVTALAVCERCGAAVPIPYQERHAEWHRKLLDSIRAAEDRAIAADRDPDDWTGPISVIWDGI